MKVMEIDFPLTEDKAEDKVFKFTNADGTVYDMTGSTAACKLYLDGPDSAPTEFAASIDVGTGKVTIPFTATHTDNQGTFEYILEETKATTQVIPLVKGNVIVIPYVPFSESIEGYLTTELPANLTLTVNYQNQRVMYWRRILQNAFEISDANLNIEAAWPTLVNALFAKLIVFDALELALKGAFIQFVGGSYTDTTTITGGDIKAIETGPTRVEYYGTSTSVKEAFSASQGGISMFDALKESICGLANHLQVKLPMCEDRTVPIIPQYHQNPDWAGQEIGEI